MNPVEQGGWLQCFRLRYAGFVRGSSSSFALSTADMSIVGWIRSLFKHSVYSRSRLTRSGYVGLSPELSPPQLSSFLSHNKYTILFRKRPSVTLSMRMSNFH